jgi:hypothetical protein
MKKMIVLLIALFSRTPQSQGIELEKVTEWIYKFEYWDVSNKALGGRKTWYLSIFIDNQVLCMDFHSEGLNAAQEYYLRNYLTGEITYRFKEPVKFRGDFEDQYGQYLFLDKDGELVIFDVREKREVAPGEPLKRPKYVYYTEKRRPTRSAETYHLLKYDLSTRQVTEVNIGNNIDISPISMSYRTLEDIGGNQLLLYNNRRNWVIQLNESMSEALSITEREINRGTRGTGYTEYIIPLNAGKYLGFAGTREGLGPRDMVDKYYVTLLDEKGAVEKEYREINMIIGNSQDIGGDILCLVSPDKRYALFLDGEQYDGVNDVFLYLRVYVYQIRYRSTGILNDDRVRVRAGPNLTGAILGVVNRGEKVKILEIGEKKQKIGAMESVWYKVRISTGTEGWIFGAYVDITE